MIRESSLERWKRICSMLTRFDLVHLRYALWVRWKRLDFSGESGKSLGIPEKRGSNHAASGGPNLKRVLGAIRVPTGSKVIDFGSGKGLAVVTMSCFFDSVVGVELSARLVEVAKQNIRKLGLTNIKFICSDAGKFQDGLDSITHVYMFNPFPAAVMDEVLLNLRRSLDAHPREMVIIYKNPICHDSIVKAGFVKRREFSFRYTHSFFIYTN